MFGFFKKTKTKTKKKPEPKPKKITTTVKTEIKPEVPAMTDNQILKTISQMQKELDKLKLAVTGGKFELPQADGEDVMDKSLDELKDRDGVVQRSGAEKVVEGVFDGQNMVGADGQQYDVPANYASKSKLVEGDILKLTVNNLGSFVYKQIKPIERLRKVGELTQDPQSLQFFAEADGKKWKLLTASVTYFKGEAGDEVVFLIPAEGMSKWAAVENIMQKD